MLGSMARFISLCRGRPSVALENIDGGFCNMVKSAYVSSFWKANFALNSISKYGMVRESCHASRSRMTNNFKSVQHDCEINPRTINATYIRCNSVINVSYTTSGHFIMDRNESLSLLIDVML